MCTGSKVVPVLPQPPDDDPVDPENEHSLGLLVTATPPKTAASSPDVVIDVAGGINADADQLSDHVRINNAPSYTMSPTSPAPDSSPLVGSPDPMARNLLQPEIAGVASGAYMHETPLAWCPSGGEEASPLSRKSGKKKSKDKDKEKSKKGKEKGAESQELGAVNENGTMPVARALCMRNKLQFVQEES